MAQKMGRARRWNRKAHPPRYDRPRMPPSTDSDSQERKEQAQRSSAWYAVLGFGALAAGASVILRWMPDNPFNTPSELPNTTRLNADRLTGRSAPMLAVRPSEMGAIGAGCRVSDVSLVQNAFGPLRHTTLQSLEGWLDRRRSTGRRAEPAGWTARPPGDDAGVGCVVELSLREGNRERRAAWSVSEDRVTVTPANDLAREIASVTPGLRRR